MWITTEAPQFIPRPPAWLRPLCRPGRLGLGLLAGLLVSAAGAWGLAPRLDGHGLRALRGDFPDRIEAVALATANDTALSADPFPVHWTGYFYQPEAAEVVFRLPPIVGASLRLDGQGLFDTHASPRQAEAAVSVHVSAGAHPLQLELSTPLEPDQYFQAGLEWQTAFGWRLVPAPYLYPEAPEPQAARQAILSARSAMGLGWLAAGCGAGLLGLAAWSQRQRLRSRTTWGLALIVSLALLLRLLFLRDLARVPNVDRLPSGSDQRSYQSFALEALRGHWPAGAFFFKPGASLALAGLYALTGPSLRTAQVGQMVLGALAAVAVFAAARRVFGAATGWVAAVLWAVFPFPIFYEAFVLTHGLEAAAGAGLLWLWLKMLDAPGWRWAAACGMWLGAAAVLRPTFLAFVPLAAASLVWRFPLPRIDALKRLALLALAAAAPIAPITWHNYQASGRFQLISGEGPLTLYLGNNRDSSGYGEPAAAMRAIDLLVSQGKADYTRQTLEDIRANPGRWAQLMLRKTAFFFSDHEVPNNVDFHREGLVVSPVLAALPLRYGEMLALALAGLTLALGWLRPWRWPATVLLLYLAGNSALVIAYVVLSRLRAPLYPALAILAGWAVAQIAEAARQRQWRRASLAALLVVLGRVTVANMLWVADNVMSLPVVAALPPGARALNAPLGDSLTLAGYEPLPVARPGEPAFVTVYWQARAPLAADLIGTLQVFADVDLTHKVAQEDHPIGAGGYPRYLTSRWSTGQIVRDQFLLLIPPDAPEPLALTVLVGAYSETTGQRLGQVTFGPLPLTRAAQTPIPADTRPVGARLGGAALAAYRAAVTDAALTVTLYWRADARLAEDGIVFVHVFDAAGRLVMGQDSRPRTGTYSTLAWQPGEIVVDEHTLTWPANTPPGEYRLAIGVYEAATQMRLAVSGAGVGMAADDVLTLGMVLKPI